MIIEDFLISINFKKVGNFERCFNYTYYNFYNVTYCSNKEIFYLTKYTKKFGRFLYQKKFTDFESFKNYLKTNILI